MELSGTEILIQRLANHDVDTIFGLLIIAGLPATTNSALLFPFNNNQLIIAEA